jgi:H+/Cl- antiporter ClcA
MTATSHALIGTIIAAKIGNPALAIPIAIASHIALDTIPHWDTATNRRKKTFKKMFSDSFFDVAIGFVLSYLLIFLFFPATNLAYAFLIIIASQLLDWITSLYYFFHFKAFKWAYSFQKLFNNDLDLPWGLVTQIILILVFVALAKVF